MKMIDPKAKSNLLYVSPEVFDQMQKIPTVDAVPVVRCCECRYKETMHDGIWCAIWKEYSREGGFCHHGKRKEVDDNG